MSSGLRLAEPSTRASRWPAARATRIGAARSVHYSGCVSMRCRTQYSCVQCVRASRHNMCASGLLRTMILECLTHSGHFTFVHMATSDFEHELGFRCVLSSREVLLSRCVKCAGVVPHSTCSALAITGNTAANEQREKERRGEDTGAEPSASNHFWLREGPVAPNAPSSAAGARAGSSSRKSLVASTRLSSPLLSS